MARFEWYGSSAKLSQALNWTGLPRKKRSTLAARLSRTYSTIVTDRGKVQRWKLYLQDKDIYLYHVPGEEVHQFVPDALSHLCENHMLKSEKPVHKRHQAFLVSIEPKHRIPDAVLNKLFGHWGLQKCREFFKDPAITDRTITQFIRQCPCCQVMSRLKILIKTHSYPTIHSRVYT